MPAAILPESVLWRRALRIGHAAVRTACVLVVLALTLGRISPAQGADAQKSQNWPAASLIADAGPRKFITDHKGVFNGQKLRYTATVAETIVKDASGQPGCSAFTIAYTAKKVKDPIERPVIFIFNGGPGSASNTLLFGAFGPKRMEPFTSAALADPSTPLVDNPYTVLDVADLVFIDPPETGFSQLLRGVPVTTFRSIDADSYAVSQIILRWLVDNGRLDSPKYLAGESYGTLRAVALARDLARATPKIQLDGLIMISQAITYNGPTSLGLRRGPNPLAAVNRLPEMAALAWYHGKIDNRGQTLDQAMQKAREFGRTGYIGALLLGNRLDGDSKRKIAEQLSMLIGVPGPYLQANNLRVQDFRGELLRGDGKALGQFDGRETEPAAARVPDASRDWDAAMRGLTVNMDSYAARELGVKGLGGYVTLVPDPYGFEETWKYIETPGTMLDVVLAEQMKANPRLRLLVPLGVFDTTSSVGSTESMFSQLDIPPERAILTYYPGGHMVYSDLPGLKAFLVDVRAFVSSVAITSAALSGVAPGRSSAQPAEPPNTKTMR